jgi:hypothetical protein
MSKLSEIENSVSALKDEEYVKFREWFWEYENEKWDIKIEKDSKSSGKLNKVAAEA